VRRESFARSTVEEADHWRPNLLRARCERPSCRSAKEGDEVAPPHKLASDEARNLATSSDDVGACASQRNMPAYVGSGSKPEFTALQQQRPLHLNQRTWRGKL